MRWLLTLGIWGLAALVLADDSHDTPTAADASAPSLTAYPADIANCSFLKRDKGYYFLEKDWHFRQSGLDLFRKHPLVRRTDYAKSVLGILDTAVQAADNPKAGSSVSDVSNAQDEEEARHGTHVAGIAASKTVGVNPHLPLASFKIATKGSLYDFIPSVINGLMEAEKNPAIRVVNLSLTSLEDPLIRERVLALTKKGVWVVYAAGNDGEVNHASAAMLRELSDVPELFSVGALNYFGTSASFSNRGPSVDFYAPGTNIQSLNAEYDPGTKGSKKKRAMSGTSMAAPYAAAVLATLRGIDPTLTPQDIAELVKETSIERGTKQVVFQVNPYLMVTYLEAIKRARAKGACRDLPSCLPAARKAVRKKIAKTAEGLTAPKDNRCEDWERYHDRLRRGFFLTRGRDPRFTDELFRVALSAPRGKAAESVYYRTGADQARAARDFEKAHGGLLSKDETEGTKVFFDPKYEPKGDKRKSSDEQEVSATTLDAVWKRCEKHFFEKSEPGFCATMFSTMPLSLRLALAKRIERTGRPLSDLDIPWHFKLRNEPGGEALHQKLVLLALDGAKGTEPDYYRLDSYIESLPELPLDRRLEVAKLVEACAAGKKDGAKDCERVRDRIAAYTKDSLTPQEEAELAKAFLDDYDGTPAVAALQLQLDRLRAGFYDAERVNGSIREVFRTWKDQDARFTKWEESHGHSGRGSLFEMLAELATQEKSAKLLGEYLSDPKALADFDELMRAKKNGWDPTWESFFTRLMKPLDTKARARLMGAIADHWRTYDSQRALRYYDFLEANADLPEVSSVLDHLQQKDQPSPFWTALRLRHLKRTVDEGRATGPELMALLDETEKENLGRLLGNLDKAKVTKDPAFVARLGKLAERRPEALDSEILLYYLESAGSRDATAPALVPYLGKLLRDREHWSYNNGLLTNLGEGLGEWSKGHPDRIAAVMAQLETVMRDAPFLAAEGIEGEDRKRLETYYRRKDLVGGITDFLTQSKGDAYLDSHPDSLEWLAKMVTDPDVDFYLRGARYPEPLKKTLLARLPEKLPVEEKSTPQWISNLAASTPKAAPRMIAYYKETRDKDLLEAIQLCLHRAPEKMSYSVKREIEELEDKFPPKDDEEGVLK